MKRSPMRRTPFRRSRRRVGRAAQERIRAGGKLAVGRASETLDGWRKVVEAVRARAGGRCEIGQDHAGTDPHHVVSRSRGGSDHADNVIFICRFHHRQVDEAYGRGRLVITALGGGKFSSVVVRKASKWASSWFAKQDHHRGDLNESAR